MPALQLEQGRGLTQFAEGGLQLRQGPVNSGVGCKPDRPRTTRSTPK
jgi:hypothetical protein